MKLYKVKIKSKNSSNIFEFIKFAQKNRIDIFITYMEEDIFDGVVFLFIGVPDDADETFRNKYGKQIVDTAN